MQRTLFLIEKVELFQPIIKLGVQFTKSVLKFMLKTNQLEKKIFWKLIKFYQITIMMMNLLTFSFYLTILNYFHWHQLIFILKISVKINSKN